MESVHDLVKPDPNLNDPNDYKKFPAVPPLPLTDNGQKPKLRWRQIIVYAIKSQGFSATKQQIASFAISNFKYFENYLNMGKLMYGFCNKSFGKMQL